MTHTFLTRAHCSSWALTPWAFLPQTEVNGLLTVKLVCRRLTSLDAPQNQWQLSSLGTVTSRLVPTHSKQQRVTIINCIMQFSITGNFRICSNFYIHWTTNGTVLLLTKNDGCKETFSIWVRIKHAQTCLSVKLGGRSMQVGVLT